MSQKYKNICTVLNCIEHLLSLVSTVTSCVSTFTFASVVSILIRVAEVGLKNCVVTTVTKNICQ